MNELQPALDWVMPLGNGDVEFVGGVASLFTAEVGGNGGLEGARGRIDLGLRRQGTGPISFAAGVFADGLVMSNCEAYGVDLNVEWRF